MSLDNTLIVGTRKGLIVYKKNVSGSWTHVDTQFLGIPVTIAHYDTNSKLWWALLDHGHWGCKLHRSTDGKNWEELNAPEYGEHHFIKEGIKAKTQLLWAIQGGPSKGQVWIGTEPGGLFMSKNDGSSFEINQALWDVPGRMKHWFGGGRDHPAIHSILIHPDNPKHLYVGISCAGVYESKDGGTTWNTKNKGLKANFLPNPNADIGQDPHLLVMCKNHPEVLWQQNHCGIFKSVNGGEEWIDVTDPDGPANFGFAIAVSEVNPDIAFVVPGVSDQMRVAVDQKLVVCRTEDGGKSWQTLAKGLPEGPSFDITYRHALDINHDNVVFGTTTGNLYASNSMGDDWYVISNNLPMVHSVQIVE